jgi:anthranilate synthase component 1
MEGTFAVRPSQTEVSRLAADYDNIVLTAELYADLSTPIRLLRRMSGQSGRYFLLESVEGGEKWARYSFLGYEPKLRVSCREGVVRIERGGKVETLTPKDVCEPLRDLLSAYKNTYRPKEAPPFAGGLVGYFAYAMFGYAEPTLKISRDDGQDYDLLLFDKVIAYDHLHQKIRLLVNMPTAGDVAANYYRAVADLAQMAALIRDESPLPKAAASPVDFHCNVTEEQYCDIVERTKEYIREGDIFQAVLSRRFTSDYKGSMINAYRVLRTTNPSPYMVYLALDDEEIMCTSPETLVRLQNGRLTTFPVAGSRPRGKTEAEDIALEQELLADEKELAEHNMLVDLGRNDLGRIAKYGSVEVTAYQMIHRYSHIMHICSQVEGDILPGLDAFDALKAVLPAGTLSGAPKIRACEIIEELEPEPRGVYGGALGYVDFSGNLDACIAIRMAVKRNGKVSVQAGGGIVADSVPVNEYAESGNKARACINALEMAQEVDF